VLKLAQPGGDEREEIFFQRIGLIPWGVRRGVEGVADCLVCQRGDDGFLGGEIVEERAAGDLGGLSDVARGGGVEALVREESSEAARRVTGIIVTSSAT